MKIKLILGCFLVALIGGLLFVVSYQSHKIDTLKTAKNVLEANNQVLLNRLEKEHNDKLEISKKNKQLKATIDNYKGDFDWRANISSDPVLLEFKRLHQN